MYKFSSLEDIAGHLMMAEKKKQKGLYDIFPAIIADQGLSKCCRLHRLHRIGVIDNVLMVTVPARAGRHIQLHHRKRNTPWALRTGAEEEDPSQHCERKDSTDASGLLKSRSGAHFLDIPGPGFPSGPGKSGSFSTWLRERNRVFYYPCLSFRESKRFWEGPWEGDKLHAAGLRPLGP